MSADRDAAQIGALAVGADEPTRPFGSTTAEGAPTQPIGLAAVGDRCASCGAPLSSDQRYCVNCGERRSRPRFSLPQAAAATEVATAPRPPRRPRASAGGTLVAGVGTLLLAMGVGVLIGRTNHTTAGQATPPKTQVVYLNGSGSAANTGARSSGAKPGKKSKSKSSAAKSKKPSAATSAKANAAASKVLGSSAKNLPPATVTVGQSGHGPGYQNGHFTGTFFGGG